MSEIRLSCPHCQASLRLPGAIPAGKKLKCPKCSGMFVSPEPEEPPEPVAVPGRMREPLADDEAPDRPVRRRRRDAEDDYDDVETRRRNDEDEEFDDEIERPRRRRRQRRRRSAERSGAVTAVGVVNIIFGVLSLLCGLVIFLGASLIGIGGKAAAQNAMPNNPQGAQAAGGVMAMAGAMAAVFAVIFIVFAALYVFAGVGVLKRQQWGRVLTIVLASLSAVGLVINVMQMAMGRGAFSFPVVSGFAVSAGYVILCLAVLFNRDYAAEFE